MRLPVLLIVTTIFFAASAQVTGGKEKNALKQSSDNKALLSEKKAGIQSTGQFELIDEEEREDLIGLIITSLDYYLDRVMEASDDRMIVRKTEKEIMVDLTDIVDDIDGRYDYHVDKQFEGFSQAFRAKTQSVIQLNWNVLPETDENGTSAEQIAVAQKYARLQVAQLKDLGRQELEAYVRRHVYRAIEQGGQLSFTPKSRHVPNEKGLVEIVAPLLPYDFHIYKQEVIDIGIYNSPELATIRAIDGRSIEIDSILKSNNEKMNALGEQLIRLEKQMADLKQQGSVQSSSIEPITAAILDNPTRTTSVDNDTRTSVIQTSVIQNGTDLAGIRNATKGVTVKSRRSTDSSTTESVSTDFSEASTVSYTFRFEKNSDMLSYSDKVKLVDVAIRMMEDPELDVVITGFADLSGTPELNARISKSRAEAVEQYLMSKYIPANRMKVDYLGASLSGSENAADRKVEVVLRDSE